jgi:hypothetical protein
MEASEVARSTRTRWASRKAKTWESVAAMARIWELTK